MGSTASKKYKEDAAANTPQRMRQRQEEEKQQKEEQERLRASQREDKEKDLQEQMVQQCLKKLEVLEGIKSGGSGSEPSTMIKWLPSSKKHIVAVSKSSEGSSDANSAPSMSELQSDAQSLTDPKEIADVYFGAGDNHGITQFRIKLLITALTLKTTSPIGMLKSEASKKLAIAKLGSVHTAIHCGTQIVEWNNSSLVIPQPADAYFNRKTLCALDLELVDELKFTTAIIPAICEVIAKWNGSKKYSEITANCQDFSTDLLKAIGVTMNFNEDSRIKKFLDNVDKMEKNEVSFQHTFEGDEEEMTFKDHASLDEACFEKIGEKCKSEKYKQSEEYKLLKSFDRVFWLRYYGYEASETLNPLEKATMMAKCQCSNLSCFFGDPATTGSVYGKAQQAAQL